MANIYEVFKQNGLPNVTYVKRDGGLDEERLSEALDRPGMICLLTGISKTGKTTLRAKVAESRQLESIVIRCEPASTPLDLWRRALESVNFERVVERQRTNGTDTKIVGEVQAEFGWRWLAKITPKLVANFSSSDSEHVTKAKILADPSPDHLLPVLKRLAVLLVFEDFHYLKPEVQADVSKQLKTFVDAEVSVVIVGTTHRARDLLMANPDLSGRVSHIQLENWSTADLQKIVTQGFDHLRIDFPPAYAELIASESVGLPIITQSVCLKLVVAQKRINGNILPKNIQFTKQNVFDAFHDVVMETYNVEFSQMHDRWRRGTTDQLIHAPSYYELLLWIFVLDPIKFSLTKEELYKRLGQLTKFPKFSLEIPSSHTLTDLLTTLEAFQMGLKRRALLEWSSDDEQLYMLEPTFLFYLRWETMHDAVPTTHDILAEVFHKLGTVRNFE